MLLQRAHFSSGCKQGKQQNNRLAANVRVQAGRRESLAAGLVLLPALANLQPAAAAEDSERSKYEPMEALRGKDYGKPRMTYPDYEMTPSGLQYKDMREGTGEVPREGDTLLVDWDGYTIGYYGRPFEARNKPKGSSFEGNDKDFYRFVLGQHSVIPAFEEAVATMKVGGIRRIVVPVELGYPDNDYKKQGPKPTTFAGERALGFVLGNQGMIDKTLLFDIELMRILK
uniref:peptidylprolyl isomerase n=1 Tax=Tetradesmus obliquus TaxID=3088 RepID=A0A383WD35_TETOB|eukprot:jgi/Sobl393_1/10197/SZX66333.1